MVKYGGLAGDQLRQYIEKIEKLEVEKVEVLEYIKEVFMDAKTSGFDVKTMKKVIQMRKKKQDEIEEEVALLDTYMHALGINIVGDSGNNITVADNKSEVSFDNEAEEETEEEAEEV